MSKPIKFFAVFALLCSFLPSLHAELGIALSLNRTRFMKYEKIYACITIRNDSGKPLLFGERPELQGFILFDIRNPQGRPVSRRSGREISVTGLFLSPGEVKRMVIPLDKYYDLTSTGNYFVYAYVGHNRLTKEYRSKEVRFVVSEGVDVWSKSVGLPDFDSDGNKIGKLQGRRYSVSVLSENGTRSYYLKVEDPGRIIAVSRIGHEVGYEKFQAEVDMLSRLHLLIPVAPRVFHYMSFNYDGVNIANSYWKTSGTIPMLFRDEQTGKVSRIGGVPAVKGRDYRDPKEGKLTIADLTGERRTNENTPQLKRESGVIDLGKGVLPGKAADEK